MLYQTSLDPLYIQLQQNNHVEWMPTTQSIQHMDVKKLSSWGWVEEIAWGLVWWSQLILNEMLKLTDDFPWDLLWFTRKNKKKLKK